MHRQAGPVRRLFEGKAKLCVRNPDCGAECGRVRRRATMDGVDSGAADCLPGPRGRAPARRLTLVALLAAEPPPCH